MLKVKEEQRGNVRTEGGYVKTEEKTVDREESGGEKQKRRLILRGNGE